MLTKQLVQKKRNGQPLTNQEIEWILQGVTSGTIPDYQVAAFLMAVYFQGMETTELAHWTKEMTMSGTIIDWSHLDKPTVDKHSTGGVGDKISVCLAPAVAACGAAVPMISGRGLGHTGGTLDKLEAIPGFQVRMELDHFKKQVAELGMALIGQTDDLAPADRRLYALRDVTATVESIPLIASSIMSKKLAEGIDSLVLDCKVGCGAFMKDLPSAKQLGSAIASIGAAAGKKVTVCYTNMDTPIGTNIGNALEIKEAIDVLQGQGPEATRKLTIELGAHMLAATGLQTVSAGKKAIVNALDSGTALHIFQRCVEKQKGDPHVIDNPARLPTAKHITPVILSQDESNTGYISQVHAKKIALAALHLGAGRKKKEQSIDPAAGITLPFQLGDSIDKGQPVAFLHHGDIGNDVNTDAALELVASAFTMTKTKPPTLPLILETSS